MRWSPSVRAWEEKWRRVEALHELMAANRLCVVVDCFDRSVVAVTVAHARGTCEVGFCSLHHRELLADLEQRGRPQPDGTVLLLRRRIGGSRLLGKGEVLDGPLAPGELKDE